jgi:type II secretory ATPase GspE/PulE/Tfp pilus assembly ATPase PilB-like protein
VYTRYKGEGSEDAKDFERMQQALGGDMGGIFVTGGGCQACRGTGTAGRSVVAEVVSTDYTMLSLIRDGKTREAIEYWQREHGGMTMRQHAVLKVRAGLVDPFAAEAVVGDLAEEVGVSHAQH